MAADAIDWAQNQRRSSGGGGGGGGGVSGNGGGDDDTVSLIDDLYEPYTGEDGDVTATDNTGKTALHVSARWGSDTVLGMCR
jgi:hypothetical protein